MNFTKIARTGSLRRRPSYGIVSRMKKSRLNQSGATKPAKSQLDQRPQELTLRQVIKLAETRAREDTARILSALRRKT